MRCSESVLYREESNDMQYAVYLQKKTRRIFSMNIVYVRDEEYLLLFEPLDVTCAFDVIRTTFFSFPMTFFVETFFVCASRNDPKESSCSITNLLSPRRECSRVVRRVRHATGDFLVGHFSDMIQARSFVGVQFGEDVLVTHTFRFSNAIDQRLEASNFECFTRENRTPVPSRAIQAQ